MGKSKATWRYIRNLLYGLFLHLSVYRPISTHLHNNSGKTNNKYREIACTYRTCSFHFLFNYPIIPCMSSVLKIPTLSIYFDQILHSFKSSLTICPPQVFKSPVLIHRSRSQPVTWFYQKKLSPSQWNISVTTVTSYCPLLFQKKQPTKTHTHTRTPASETVKVHLFQRETYEPITLILQYQIYLDSTETEINGGRVRERRGRIRN